MTGWHISVFRQEEAAAKPASPDPVKGARLAVWQADDEGLAWIQALVKSGDAIDLGSDGYPSLYTAPTKHLIPTIIKGPPAARETWFYEAGDILTDQWAGKTIVDKKTIKLCKPDEWLIVEAWDES